MKHTFGGSGNKRLLNQYTKGERRAEGGRISEDSQREAKRLNAQANYDALVSLGKGAAAGYALNKFGQAIGGPKTASRILGAVTGLSVAASDERRKRSDAAASEARRIEAGLAEPGKEDRKHGGRVKR